MTIARLSMSLAVVLLAACDEAAPVPAATPTSRASVSAGAEVAGPPVRILAFGDSLFAGYGLSPAQSYPARLEAALRARGVNARMTNAAVSGETSVAAAQRLAFVLDAQPAPPDLVLLELGGNDMLRQLPPAETRAAFAAMLGELQKRGLRTVVMGMRAPPNLGPAYAEAFDALYPELAARYGADLVPFWLEAIYRRPELFQADRLHPTAPGIEALVAATDDAILAALPRD